MIWYVNEAFSNEYRNYDLISINFLFWHFNIRAGNSSKRVCSCVAIITAQPFLQSWWRRLRIFFVVSGSKFPVGSSAKISPAYWVRPWQCKFFAVLLLIFREAFFGGVPAFLLLLRLRQFYFLYLFYFSNRLLLIITTHRTVDMLPHTSESYLRQAVPIAQSRFNM